MKIVHYYSLLFIRVLNDDPGAAGYDVESYASGRLGRPDAPADLIDLSGTYRRNRRRWVVVSKWIMHAYLFCQSFTNFEFSQISANDYL